MDYRGAKVRHQMGEINVKRKESMKPLNKDNFKKRVKIVVDFFMKYFTFPLFFSDYLMKKKRWTKIQVYYQI